MAHKNAGTKEIKATFIVLVALSPAALAAIDRKGWDDVETAAKALAEETDTHVVGIWQTDSESYSVVAAVKASNADKALGFLKAFTTIKGAMPHEVLKIDARTSNRLAEALCHTKMEGKG